VLVIDGGHDLNIAYSDLINMRELARDEHVVVMDDLRCSQYWCRPASASWHYLMKTGFLREHGCIVHGCCNGWCWGAYSLTAVRPDPGGVCGEPLRANSSKHTRKCHEKTRLLPGATTAVGQEPR